MNELYRKTVGGFKLFADRAVCDEDGNNIKTTKQNHNIAEVTPVANAMNLLATTSSGDIVRTNLEFNTALTTKFLSQSGAWLTVDSDSWKKYSVDHGCTGDDSSIYIGTNNSARGKSILFGVGNSTSGVSGIKNHATLIGFDNTSTSDIEYFERTINNVTTQVQCNSILMGSKNTSEHHNAILIGMLNNALEPISAADKTINTHDDGFMMAVGYENTVGRNYDFAYGYQSVANGGENIAFQHSSAIGYRNIAFVDSTVNGTGNIGIMESRMNVSLTGYEPDTEALTHNTLLNAVLTSANSIQSGYGFHHNLLMSVTASLDAPMGAVGNIFWGGRNRDEYAQYMYHPITLSTAEAAITGNIILGNLTTGTTITTVKGMRNNMIIHPEGFSITSGNAVADNWIMNANVNLTNSELVMYNFVHASTISGDVGPFVNNVVLGASKMRSDDANQSLGMCKNVLFSNSELVHTDVNTSWSDSYQPTSENFLFGTKGEDLLGCFSFGDCPSDSSTTNSPVLRNCLRTFNFGDNTISRTLETFVGGSENNVKGVLKSFVFGTNNSLTGNTTTKVGYASTLEFTYVFGADNILQTSSDYNSSRSMVRGIQNNIMGRFSDLDVFGNSNVMGTGNDNTSYTLISSQSAFELAVSSGTRTIIKTAAAYPMVASAERMVSGSKIENYRGYQYIDGVLYKVNWVPTGVSYTSLTGAEIVARYKNQTLVQNAWYQCTANYTIQANDEVYASAFTDPGAIYLVGNGRIDGVDVKLWCSRVSVNGDKNTIYRGITDSAVFGSEHVLLSDGMSYSNIFVQGYKHVISNGSGIISMGCANIARGHGSVAIGNQLVSNQWQTVIGKYNDVIDGPERLAEGSTESDKALFIIGNGYADTDKDGWQSDAAIHRSNAMVVYADGTVKAKKFVTDEPELELTAGQGISIVKSVNEGTITISAQSNIPAAPQNPGTYALQCVVDSNGDATYSWAAIGLSN